MKLSRVSRQNLLISAQLNLRNVTRFLKIRQTRTIQMMELFEKAKRGILDAFAMMLRTVVEDVEIEQNTTEFTAANVRAVVDVNVTNAERLCAPSAMIM